MGDKIAQLIFEKLKTPTVKETNDLDDTRRSDRRFGSTDIRSEQSQDIKPKIQLQKTDEDQSKETNEEIPMGKDERPQVAEARRIISARELQKLGKNDLPVFLAIVRVTNDSPNKQCTNR